MLEKGIFSMKYNFKAIVLFYHINSKKVLLTLFSYRFKATYPHSIACKKTIKIDHLYRKTTTYGKVRPF